MRNLPVPGAPLGSAGSAEKVLVGAWWGGQVCGTDNL